MNCTENYTLTIIVPVYNEEENIRYVKERVGAYLPGCPVPACVLFVDDGSSDRGLERIREVCEETPHFYYVALRKNGGLSCALKAGIDYAGSRYIGYIDADMQTDVRDFDLLLPYIHDYPLVMGIRACRKDSSFKRAQSRVANSFRRMITHDRATDTGCPLKIMWTDYARRIPFFSGMHRFLPALIGLQEGGCFREVAVRHYPRKAGISKYHFWNRSVSPLIDCFVFRWMKCRFINYKVSDTNVVDDGI